MNIKVTNKIIKNLAKKGVSIFENQSLPSNSMLEPPCSLKWMEVHHSISLGAFSYAVSGFYMACRIGRYTSIGEGVQIGRHGHPLNWASCSPVFYMDVKEVLDLDYVGVPKIRTGVDFKFSTPPATVQVTHIHHDVWIGHEAFILPGVTVGTGAVVAARSVVTKDVEPYSVVAGVPAKIIRKRFDSDTIDKLLDSKWWEFSPWQLKGVAVDDIEEFLAHVKAIRESNIQPYKPIRLNLSDYL
jgi:acetyltransferase-like isoleucine patch superfamily enzyme